MQDQKKTSIALKKARSSLDKIITMVENGEYCIDIIQQNLAVIGLLKATNLKLLQGHLGACFVDAIKKGTKKQMQEMISEILAIVRMAQNK